MIVARTVSYLEMVSPADFRPAALTGQLAAHSWDDSVGRLKIAHDDIARAHRWPSLLWSETQWQRRLRDPDINILALTNAAEVVGLVELQQQPAEQVELTIFGVLPHFQGRGLGAPALTLAVQAAWRFGIPTRRVWLHTSTRDGPRALENYRRIGFAVYATEVRTEDLD